MKTTNAAIMQKLNSLSQELKSNSSLTGFRQALAQLNGTERDLYSVFDYPDEVDKQQFTQKYNRNAIAYRAVKSYPEATWKDVPVIEDDTGEDGEETEFIRSWNLLTEKHNIFSYFERADRLNCLQRFSLLVMGFKDGKPLHEPLSSGNYPLAYIRPYSEEGITIAQWETDTASPRYGMPVTYTVRTGNVSGKDAIQAGSFTVHHSRVLHIAEGLEDNEVYGTPILQSVFNCLNDLEKVSGGAAESFFKDARNAILVTTAEDAEFTAEDQERFKEQVDEFVNKQRKSMIAQGASFTPVSGQMFDPSGHVSTLLDQIAGALGIPKRILIGSERGELASSQDESNWSSKIDGRRNKFAIHQIVKPFIELMIKTGNVADPAGEWSVYWNDGDSLSESQKADIALKKTQAIATYSNTPMAETIITPSEFREMLGYDAEGLPDVEELPELPEYEEQPIETQETFKPPKGVQEEAQRAIDWREEHGDEVKGGTQVGWTRARQLANGEGVSAETINRMVSFFARHEGNEVIDPKFEGKPWQDAGYVAWLLWGGDAGRSWSEKIKRGLEKDV